MTRSGEPLGSVMSRLATEDPNQKALIVDGLAVSRRELEEASNQLGWVLIDAGAGVDDLVTITSANPVQLVAATIAAWKIGATPQPVSSRLPDPELRGILDLADPPVVVGVDAQHDLGRQSIPPRIDFSSSRASVPPPERVATSWKAPTSGGTTGNPKLILSTDPARFDPAQLDKWRIQPGSTLVIPAPLHHNAPFQTALYGILAGCTVVHLSRFDPATTLDEVDRHHAQWLYLVPTMMSRIWRMLDVDRASYSLHSLETVWHLAAPCPPWLKKAWVDWLGPHRIWELYSATEGIAYTIISGAEWLQHPGSVGRVVTGEMRVLDDAGAQLEAGKVGEIFMHPGPSRRTPYRYVGAEVRMVDGWQSVGDMGYFDREGYLYLCGRKADMVIIGGVNVYPAEVEAALEQHPKVHSSIVVGLPDDDLGQRLHAIVQAVEGTSQADIQKYVRNRLAPFKVPRTVEFVTEQLSDDTGKTRRGHLRSVRAHRSARQT